MAFAAMLITKGDAGQSVSHARLEIADLMPGEVTLRTLHSTVNYKDGLAVTGRGPVIRSFPMIPGIDFVGEVVEASAGGFATGDVVISTGAGMGESHYGGYAGMARVPAAHLVPLPAGMRPEEAMAIGTAGFTAMQCLIALERHGMTPAAGDLLVTGASGGVGSIAVAVAARAGWRVIASTGRIEETEYLKGLGADEVIDRATLAAPGKPLARERWAAAIDAVGSVTLANVLAATRANGAVAACGLAQGMDLPVTVAPFILRGVALLGVNSVDVAPALRAEIWRRLARDLDRGALAAMTRTIPFDGVAAAADAILAGKVRGRLVVDMAAAR
jgi:acrylyl-CoA reductase (NADPH)